MNCRSFRKFVGAFADGELETQTNAEALEHLNTCPPCVHRVDEVHQMKDALGRVFGAETGPSSLHGAVRASLGVGPPAERQASPGVIHRLFVPIGVAAAVVAAVAIWQSAGPPAGPAGGPTVPAFLAVDAGNVHDRCAVHGLEHHDARLGRDLDGIARKMSAELGMKVIAPALEQFGFKLLGADACLLMGQPSGHVLFRGNSGGELSVFSLSLPDCKTPALAQVRGFDGRAYRVDRDERLSLVAWSEGCTTYLFCAELPADDLLEMASQVRGAP